MAIFFNVSFLLISFYFHRVRNALFFMIRHVVAPIVRGHWENDRKWKERKAHETISFKWKFHVFVVARKQSDRQNGFEIDSFWMSFVPALEFGQTIENGKKWKIHCKQNWSVAFLFIFSLRSSFMRIIVALLIYDFLILLRTRQSRVFKNNVKWLVIYWLIEINGPDNGHKARANSNERNKRRNVEKKRRRQNKYCAIWKCAGATGKNKNVQFRTLFFLSFSKERKREKFNANC